MSTIYATRAATLLDEHGLAECLTTLGTDPAHFAAFTQRAPEVVQAWINEEEPVPRAFVIDRLGAFLAFTRHAVALLMEESRQSGWVNTYDAESWRRTHSDICHVCPLAWWQMVAEEVHRATGAAYRAN